MVILYSDSIAGLNDWFQVWNDNVNPLNNWWTAFAPSEEQQEAAAQGYDFKNPQAYFEVNATTYVSYSIYVIFSIFVEYRCSLGRRINAQHFISFCSSLTLHFSS